MEQITHKGKQYVSLDRASSESRYDREYLRKLASARKIEAVQIGDIWMLNLESIAAYRAAKPQRKPQGTKKKAKAR